MAPDELPANLKVIRQLSDSIVEAQRPIRILDAVKWDDAVRIEFFANKCQHLPDVDRSYYHDSPLAYDPVLKRSEFLEIELDIKRRLGEYSPVGGIMRRMCREYIDTLRMIETRGTPDFSRFSQELYGSAHDRFYEGEPTLADFGSKMAEALTAIDDAHLLAPEPRTIPAADAVKILSERLTQNFAHPIEVLLSDGIVADAAAGSNYIKLRTDAVFNDRDLRVLEVHEGWVHVGTTLNGMAQPVCTFLSKGPPSSTITQEGLAILVENLSFLSHPERLRRVANRIRAVGMAEDGANFLDIFRFYLEQGLTEDDAYSSTARVFRGSTPDGQPFTKDVSYSKGFILIYNYLQLAIRQGLIDRIPLLFCGKTTLGDLRTISHLVEEGIVVRPKILPPQFADLRALAAWMCYSSFLRGLNLDRIAKDYAAIL
ncbi:MAG: flavohemoglobin expression-modulating QEGLA motif protein [Pirellulaceae bacterium]